MEPNELTRFFDQLTPLQIGVISLALLFLIVGLRLILRKPPTHLTAFTGEAGNVLVSRKALQALIKQACLLDDWVEAARPIVRVRGSVVTSRVEVRLAAPDNLKEVCERLQGRVTALLQKSLSFDQIGDIQIIVKGFTISEDARAGALPELEAASESAAPSRESSLTPPRKSSRSASEDPAAPPPATQSPATGEAPYDPSSGDEPKFKER